MSDVCQSRSPESGTPCTLPPTMEAHRAGHRGSDGGSGVGWNVTEAEAAAFDPVAAPDDEAAWEAWAEYADHWNLENAWSQERAFMAGRESMRANAAAQALEDAADAVPSVDGEPVLGWGPVPAWLRVRAAQYREKETGK